VVARPRSCGEVHVAGINQLLRDTAEKDTTGLPPFRADADEIRPGIIIEDELDIGEAVDWADEPAARHLAKETDEPGGIDDGCVVGAAL
jgi:hypothetical protein